jgi:hypothetical protein
MSPPTKPPAKVRRSLDVSPLPPIPSQLRVRAFMECFDREDGLPALVMEGEIHADHFQIRISGAQAILLPAVTGADGHGSFAWLTAQEQAVGEHHGLRIDDDAHDADTSLAAISYYELPRDLVARRELVYASRWYSVYFNALGLVDGCGSGGPRSRLPSRLPS